MYLQLPHGLSLKTLPKTQNTPTLWRAGVHCAYWIVFLSGRCYSYTCFWCFFASALFFFFNGCFGFLSIIIASFRSFWLRYTPAISTCQVRVLILINYLYLAWNLNHFDVKVSICMHNYWRFAKFNYYLFITLFLNTVIAIPKIHHYIAAKYTKYAA